MSVIEVTKLTTYDSRGIYIAGNTIYVETSSFQAALLPDTQIGIALYDRNGGDYGRYFSGYNLDSMLAYDGTTDVYMLASAFKNVADHAIENQPGILIAKVIHSNEPKAVYLISDFRAKRELDEILLNIKKAGIEIISSVFRRGDNTGTVGYVIDRLQSDGFLARASGFTISTVNPVMYF